MGFVIEQVQKPTLVLAHNKTLAAQLCSEFREFFPDNAVEYFVSYYDYYQPEAYVPHQDLYIEKDSSINDEIDRLRHAATAALFAREDVIIVASVSAIYGIGSPELYKEKMLLLQAGRVDRPRRDAAQARLDAVHRATTRTSRAATSACAARCSRCIRPMRRAPTGSSCSATRSSRSSTSTRSPARSTTTSATSSVWPATHYVTSDDIIERSLWRDAARAERARARGSSARARSWRRTACASAPSTTWRCSRRWASARGSRTTRGSSTAARQARRRTR